MLAVVSEPTSPPHSPTPTPREFWEDRYAGAAQIWSGRVNRVVADVAAALPPGRALDLGCGEGGDALWLAAAGWTVTGVDISPTAIARARAAAAAAGLDAEFVVSDLSTWSTPERFDLVTASFLHAAEVPLPRDEILRRARDLVAPGGGLLVVSHVAAPSWSRSEALHAHRFPTPESDLRVLGMPDDGWEIALCETRTRELSAPTGEAGTIDDGVVLIRRIA
jgi:SAM-dependent methyltransferase